MSQAALKISAAFSYLKVTILMQRSSVLKSFRTAFSSLHKIICDDMNMALPMCFLLPTIESTEIFYYSVFLWLLLITPWNKIAQLTLLLWLSHQALTYREAQQHTLSICLHKYGLRWDQAYCKCHKRQRVLETFLLCWKCSVYISTKLYKKLTLISAFWMKLGFLKSNGLCVSINLETVRVVMNCLVEIPIK